MNLERTASLALAAPALVAALILTGCGTAGPDDAASPASTASSTGAGELPEEVELPQEGGSYGLVILGTGDRAELEAAAKPVEALGYLPYITEIECFQGEDLAAFDIAEGTLVNPLYFDTLEQAEQFATGAEARDIPVIGTAQITAGCLDG